MQSKLELVHVSDRLPERHPPSAPGARRRMAWLAAAEADSGRLEAMATDRLSSDGLGAARVLLVGFSDLHLDAIRQQLRTIGVTATAAAATVERLEDVAAMRVGFTHVFVGLDAFDSVEDAVDALIAFRSSAPDVIVLIFSETVSGDDLGRERVQICDATLRLPISVPRLRNALVTAGQFHAQAS